MFGFFHVCAYVCVCMFVCVCRREIWVVLQGSIIRALNLSCFTVYVPLAMFAMFSVYAASGGLITPKRVFTILSLLSVARLLSIHLFIIEVLLISEGIVALKRIQVFTLVIVVSGY